MLNTMGTGENLEMNLAMSTLTIVDPRIHRKYIVFFKG